MNAKCEGCKTGRAVAKIKNAKAPKHGPWLVFKVCGVCRAECLANGFVEA